ncbi:sulfotransferase [Parafilimonas sp.]|uniref:sulfotransferase n=1 Tax=Parafilimonas sp. TaxID=1969739 RepID=UPI0039E24F19
MAEGEKYLDRPIIIIGSGRSGTTIMSEIIFQHEDLAWHSNWQELIIFTPLINLLRPLMNNRLWRFRKFHKYIGVNKNTRQKHRSKIDLVLFNPIERYRFWEYITGKRIDFSRSFLMNEKATPAEVKRIRSFLNKQVKYQGKKRLIMKFTGPARLEYLTSVFPDAIVVNVVREPVATVRSWLEVGFWQRMGIDKLWWRGAYTPEEIAFAETIKNKPALLTALQYKKLMETAQQEIDKLGLKVYECRYEDFVKAPQAFIHKMMDFMQLPPSKHINAYLENMIVDNRNERQPASEKSAVPEETRQQILAITGNYY